MLLVVSAPGVSVILTARKLHNLPQTTTKRIDASIFASMNFFNRLRQLIIEVLDLNEELLAPGAYICTSSSPKSWTPVLQNDSRVVCFWPWPHCWLTVSWHRTRRRRSYSWSSSGPFSPAGCRRWWRCGGTDLDRDKNRDQERTLKIIYGGDRRGRKYLKGWLTISLWIYLSYRRL